jgi:hypothetical protein
LVNEIIRCVSHSGHNDGDVIALPLGLNNPTSDSLDGVDVGHGGTAILLNDKCHAMSLFHSSFTIDVCSLYETAWKKGDSSPFCVHSSDEREFRAFHVVIPLGRLAAFRLCL